MSMIERVKGNLMLRRILVIIFGTFLFLGSIGFDFYSHHAILSAIALDSGYSYAAYSDCSSSVSFHIDVPKRLMSESETQVLTVHVFNRDRVKECVENVTLDAPKFSLNRNEQVRTIVVPPGKPASLGWILTPPQELGTFTLMISISEPEEIQTVGVTVTNTFGLNIWQAQLLSYLGTFLGTFLGPILTITWWYDIWKKRRRRKKKKEVQTIPVNTTKVLMTSEVVHQKQICSKCGSAIHASTHYCANCIAKPEESILSVQSSQSSECALRRARSPRKEPNASKRDGSRRSG